MSGESDYGAQGRRPPTGLGGPSADEKKPPSVAQVSRALADVRTRMGEGRALFFDRTTGMIVVRHKETPLRAGELVAARLANDGFF
jgi:hypothetical protein